MNNEQRHGRITSSKAYLVAAMPRSKNEIFTKGALTYFQQKRSEKRIKRTLGTMSHSQSLTWGLFMEMIVFDLLGVNYVINSQDTTIHPDPEFSDFWSGSCDLLAKNIKVGEIKCFGLEKGLALKDCIMQKNVQLFKTEFKEIYWQIVSICILEEVSVGEIIAYNPYYNEMPAIKDIASNYEGKDEWKYRFIVEKDIMELPCIPEDGYYDNVTCFEFEIPQEDIDHLNERVRMAIPYLNINYGLEEK